MSDSEGKETVSSEDRIIKYEVNLDKFTDDSSKLETRSFVEQSNKIINKLEKLNKPYIIALDLSGNELTSPDFSDKIQNIALNGYSTIVFLIGGSLGMSSKLIQMSNYKVCFSKLTFPHQLIRLFLLEQIFRAFKISNNETYHH